MTGLVVFDTNRKCFVGEIPLRVHGIFGIKMKLNLQFMNNSGRVKFLFALKTPSTYGGTAFALVTQSEDYGQFVVNFYLSQIIY